MKLNPVRILLIFAAVAAAGPAYAEVAMQGILSTGSHQVGIDSADVRIDTVSILVPTAGWQGDSLAQDTFSFPPLARWPTAIKVFYKAESTLVLPLDSVVRDSWYVLPGFGPAEPMVMFHEVSGIVESHPGRLRKFGFSIEPSVTSGSAIIRAQLGTGDRYSIEVYDAAGNRIRTLAGAATDRGGVSRRLQGDDGFSRFLPGGIYYCRLSLADYYSVRKLVLTR
jgi:hypothetical protein